MAHSTHPSGSETQTARLDSLKQRHAQLMKQKLAAEAEYNQSLKNLSRLQEEAMATYGTADPDSLQALYDSLYAENEQKIRSFAESLDQVEATLAAATRQS